MPYDKETARKYANEYYVKNREAVLKKQKEKLARTMPCDFCRTNVKLVMFAKHLDSFLHKKNAVNSLNLTNDELVRILKDKL
jgi:hypothetical protein